MENLLLFGSVPKKTKESPCILMSKEEIGNLYRAILKRGNQQRRNRDLQNLKRRKLQYYRPEEPMPFTVVREKDEEMITTMGHLAGATKSRAGMQPRKREAKRPRASFKKQRSWESNLSMG